MDKDANYLVCGGTGPLWSDKHAQKPEMSFSAQRGRSRVVRCSLRSSTDLADGEGTLSPTTPWRMAPNVSIQSRESGALDALDLTSNLLQSLAEHENQQRAFHHTDRRCQRHPPRRGTGSTIRSS